MRFVRLSQELIPIRPLVQNPNLDRSEVQVAPPGLDLQSLVLTHPLCIRQGKPTVHRRGCLAAQAAGVSSAVRCSGAFASPGRMSAR